MSDSSDAVDREAAWLATSGDGLPALLTSAGGPFAVVQAYRPRTPERRALGQLYVLRGRIQQRRFANQRVMNAYAFRLELVWPITKGTGNAEDEQRAFDAAVELVLQRILGFPLDKTHGGRFLQVAEDPRNVDVAFDPPEQTIPTDSELRATISYGANDPDFTG